MKKKANVPITILVLGIFAVCAIALASFIISQFNIREAFVGVGLIEEMNSQIEEYGVHGDLGRVDTKVNDRGERVFYQERRESFGILFKEEIVVFSVEYKVPS